MMVRETALSRKYAAYLEYRDSGVEWLGNVPESWELAPLKYIARFSGGGTPSKDNLEYWNGNIPWVSPKDMKSSRINSSIDKITERAVQDSATNVLDEGALLLVVRSGILQHSIPVAINNVSVTLNQDMKALRFNRRLDVRYALYVVSGNQKSLLLEWSKQGATVESIEQEYLSNTIFPIPSIEEQQQIANFLDHETAKIDTLIEKQQQLIELLKEKRQAVISLAVTKGINANAPMRDSSVEWLGEVPEHWLVSNLNYVLEAIGDVDHYMPKSVDSGIPYLMTGDLKESASNIDFDTCKQVSYDDFLNLSKKIRTSKGDVIMARYATIGTVSYVDVDAEFLVSYSCVTIKPDLSKVVGLYLYYYFKSDAFLQGIKNQVNTNTQGNVGVGDLKKLKVALPPAAEQEKTIEYLQSKMSKLDRIANRAKEAIKLMKERRTALISAAVTGKIDVRSWLG
jgi:type I restriction enzyme, S subunit